jgi:putative ABC transport system substrate-binding protein
MSQRALVLLRKVAILAVLVVLVPHSVLARNPTEMPQIGVVSYSTPELSAQGRSALTEGLRQLGYEEGRNISILHRFANHDSSRFAAIINDLVAVPVDVVVVTPPAAEVAAQITKTVPIVCPILWDPIGKGLIKDFSHPGGNVTGLYALTTETDTKRLELAMEVVPDLKRAGVMFSGDPTSIADAESLRSFAKRRGVTLHTYVVADDAQLRRATTNIENDRLQALIVFNSPVFIALKERIFTSLGLRLPTFADGRDFAEAGALLTYSANYIEMWRRAAVYVDKILKGASPATLPVEQAAKFELIVNMRTARSLGITVPNSVLLRADAVIR